MFIFLVRKQKNFCGQNLLKLKRYREVIFTSVLDFLILLMAWFVFHSFFAGELNLELRYFGTNVAVGGIVLSFYWIVIFVLTGLYSKLYLVSRLDEFLKVIRSTIIGALILYFLASTEDTSRFMNQKTAIISYWGIVFGMISLNRFIIRTIQRFFAQHGKGLHRTVIVGTGVTAKNAYEDLLRNKILGMEVLGFINVNGKSPSPEVGIEKEEVLGDLNSIENIVKELQVQDILVALEPERRNDLVEVISRVDFPEVSLKLLPDFYQLVSGLNRTNQIFGLPLIEISPVPLPLWERVAKRLFDILIALFVLIISLPFLFFVAIAIKITSIGPAIYKQKRVGRDGKEFTMYKFRTMYNDAEQHSGPTWAKEKDPRVTRLGYWLRKLRIDEIPQLVNVLKGDMSLVGPRPERPHFVNQFKNQIPLYTRRLRVRPGITGWAQVKWKYDSSLDDVKEKTKFDLFYVENMSLKMDAKILINTLVTVLKGKGQ